MAGNEVETKDQNPYKPPTDVEPHFTSRPPVSLGYVSIFSHRRLFILLISSVASYLAMGLIGRSTVAMVITPNYVVHGALLLAVAQFFSLSLAFGAPPSNEDDRPKPSVARTALRPLITDATALLKKKAANDSPTLAQEIAIRREQVQSLVVICDRLLALSGGGSEGSGATCWIMRVMNSPTP